MLQVVRQAMENFMLEQRSNEIMECMAQFKKQWEMFSAKVDQHGKQLKTTLKSFEDLSGTRTNQLGKQVRKIEELQASPVDGADAIGDGDAGPDENFPPLREVASA